MGRGAYAPLTSVGRKRVMYQKGASTESQGAIVRDTRALILSKVSMLLV
jgi:hypothetical protein